LAKQAQKKLAGDDWEAAVDSDEEEKKPAKAEKPKKEKQIRIEKITKNSFEELEVKGHNEVLTLVKMVSTKLKNGKINKPCSVFFEAALNPKEGNLGADLEPKEIEMIVEKLKAIIVEKKKVRDAKKTAAGNAPANEPKTAEEKMAEAQKEKEKKIQAAEAERKKREEEKKKEEEEARKKADPFSGGDGGGAAATAFDDDDDDGFM